MSTQITTAFVEQYKSNVFHLAQQKGSRLRGAVKTETVTGKAHFFERIGSTAAQLRTSRHSDTPRVDTPHSRRKVTMNDYDWADLIDNEDKVCYSYQCIIAKLMRDDEMEEIDAIEYFEYNMMGAYVGSNTPCFLFTKDD